MNECKEFCELICRACLGSGRLYNIYEYQLADIYNQLIGDKVLPCDNMPQNLCAVCCTMLLKLTEFKNQCLKAQIILDNIKEKQHAITSNSISKNLKVCRKYSQTITKITTYPQTDVKIKDIRKSLDINEVENIKNGFECLDSSMKVNEYSLNGCHQLYIDNVKNEEIQFDKQLIETKTEDFNENGVEANTEVFNENDIESKIKKAKHNIEKDKKCKIEKDVDVKKSKFKRAAKVNKIKGKYFETKENMTNFESMYDVEIVILTKEQQLNDLLERKSSHNYLNSPFKCQYCYKGFIDEDNLKKHFKAQHDPSRGDVTCEFCQYRYKDKRGLNQHLKSHRLKFVCRQCKYVSRTTYNAKEHFKMHRGYLHECKDCGKCYEKLSTYLTHMRIHHPAELVWCDLCGEPFIGEFGLNGHKKRAHRDLQFPSDCACRCGARFTNPIALRVHASARACAQPCCSLCGQAFPTRLLLKDHLLEKHRGVDKYYSCTKCSKIFRSESLYSAHYRRMHAESTLRGDAAPPWVCEICGKTVPNKSRLVYHQRIHTGERPYQCPQCPKSFTMSKLLRSHSRVHSNERPYACKYCPKTFKGPSALRGHEYMHTGGKMKNSRNRNGVI
ncbi:zinc finger protein 2 homolog [Manduca sexta]|uniref:Uncharacterized protein n=1 Tax=Manduca sexta TaxID=7130 RepID=A0A922D008_MANSE|nr:zinc finger protein 2 homolog [Manduca sexta]KAG6463458.1 hypothetical protein O3G_MSEX013883 [Manduca sexta]